jgi:hypothetical protein
MNISAKVVSGHRAVEDLICHKPFGSLFSSSFDVLSFHKAKVKPGLPGPQVRFSRVQTLVREASPLVSAILLRAIGTAGFRNQAIY